MSNSFDGTLREFPFISVDRFNTGSSVFLLTHFHEDHLVGLANESFKGVVYCSEGTKALMQCSSRYRSVARNFCALPSNIATRIEISDSQKAPVYVTLVEAYHCPGACMFLVEQTETTDSDLGSLEASLDLEPKYDAKRAVLITGDIKAEQWWRESLHTVPGLQPYLSGECQLDNIYFDSTFAYRGEPFIEMPPNNMGIHAAICLLRKYPLHDPEIQYLFPDTTLGFEQVWAFFAGFFRCAIHIADSGLKEKIEVAAKFDRSNGAILAKALKQPSRPRKLTMHVGKGESKKIEVSVKQCIDFNVMDYAGICCPIPLSTISESEALQLLHTTTSGTKLFQLRGRTWLLPKSGNELLPSQIKLIFSRHSSFTETKHLLCMFQPKQLFPCVYSRDAWLKGFTMSRVFPEVCPSLENHFDQMMLKQYGLPTRETMGRPVLTINRWEIDQCKREQKLVQTHLDHLVSENTALQNQGPALINLRRVVRLPKQKKMGDADDYLNQRRKDFSIQRLVGGKRNKSYEDFLRQQQELYKDRYQNQQMFDPSKHSSGQRSTLGGTSDYATDSCDSSMDLLQMMEKPRIFTSNSDHLSIVSETQQEHNSMCLQKNLTPTGSFVASSFDSFEESQDGKKRRKPSLHNIYYHSEARLDAKKIDELSRDLKSGSQCWFDVRVMSEAPAVKKESVSSQVSA